MYLSVNLVIIVNHFPPLQRPFCGGCRKANPVQWPCGLSSTITGGIDTPFADAYIFYSTFYFIGPGFPRMASTPFGEHLKREREMRGVTLEEISAATRISTRFLEALENEHWEELPGGVFNRGFIRSVARFLGLDEDALVSEYALETKNRPGPHIIELDTPSAMPRNWRPPIAAAVALILIFFGAWFVYSHFGSHIAAGLHRRSTVTAPSSTSAPAPEPGASH
jgi:hypothetical protein